MTQIPFLPDPTKEPAERPTDRGVPIAVGSDGRMVLDTLDKVYRFARLLVMARLVPESLQGNSPDESAAKVAVALNYGNSVGLDPALALRWIYVVRGMPTLWGDAVPALCVRRPDWRGMTETWTGLGAMGEATDTTVATCEARRQLANGDIWTVSRSYSYQEARKSGKLDKSGGVWGQHTKRMLEWKARNWTLRDLYPDVLVGVDPYIDEDDVIVQAQPASATNAQLAVAKLVEEATPSGAKT